MKKIIFDLDNTLLFIPNDWIAKYQKNINKNKLDIPLEELYSSIVNAEKNNSDIITKT